MDNDFFKAIVAIIGWFAGWYVYKHVFMTRYKEFEKLKLNDKPRKKRRY